MESVRRLESTGQEVPPQHDVLASLFDLLRDVELASIATVTPQLESHIFNSYFCYLADETLRIWILTSPESVHARCLATNTSVSMAIASTEQPWPLPKLGVQLFGHGRRVPDSEVGTPIEAYGDRYPEFPGVLSDPSSLAGLENRFFEFVMDRAKLFDEARFGAEVWIDVVF